MLKDISLSIEEDFIPQGTSVTATIDTNEEVNTYAWYVYYNNERIEVKQYSPQLKSITINMNKAGTYFFKAFVMNEKGNKSSKKTKPIKVYNENGEVPDGKRSIKGLYKGMVIPEEKIEDLKIDYGTPTILTICKDKVPYDFLIKTKRDSPYLYIIGSGAYNSKEFKPPVFQRHSWAKELDANVIYYNDPTLYLDEINLGWGQGTKQNFYLENMAHMIKTMAKKLNIANDKILFYGSSAGGFMSLMLGGYLKGSSVLVNNPQTVVPNYFKHHVRGMYQASYPDMTEHDIEDKYKLRLDVIEFYQSLGYMPNIYYLQNAACEHDMVNHYNVFNKKVNVLLKASTNSQFISHLYWDEKKQHNPLDKEDTLYFITKATEMFLTR